MSAREAPSSSTEWQYLGMVGLAVVFIACAVSGMMLGSRFEDRARLGPTATPSNAQVEEGRPVSSRSGSPPDVALDHGPALGD